MTFAGGGYTGNGARSGGVDGQGGFPAILHPQETVVDHYSAARGAMASGTAVAAGKSELDAQQMEAEMMNNPAPIDIRYDTTVINDVSYVTEEQMRASNREAVKEARARVFADMRNKPATRAQVGI